ncbi:hypothetical protein, partial [Aliivibrio fischeri]|uniref:hypothetical protein n=1 Tax=Aliivibrio fischeri TaxID=668 RepID=UPI00080EDFAD
FVGYSSHKEIKLNGVEIVTVIKDFILAGAAITGAVVAVKGLGTWRRQLKGQSEYELSRRILVGLFKYRDAINSVRNPAMFSYELSVPSEEEVKTMNQEDIHYYGVSKAYQNRWSKVQEQRTSLYADQLEVEAIWGGELNELFKILFALEHELFTLVRHYLIQMDPKANEARKDAIIRRDQKRRDIMYDESDDEPDEFKQELLDAISNIEDYLKPKLRH